MIESNSKDPFCILMINIVNEVLSRASSFLAQLSLSKYNKQGPTQGGQIR